MILKKQPPPISVIIPNYNHSQFLKQRIESVINQTYKNFELIILDDCSTDQSNHIINEYASSPKVSHIVFNDVNSGSPFLQWKKGIDLAKGEFIWIAESDDYSDLTFLEKLVPLLEDNPECYIALCGSNLVDEQGNTLDIDWDRYKEKKGVINKFEGKYFLKNRMLFDNSIYNAGMALFRKSAIPKINDNFINFKYCGDWYFWNNICNLGSVIRYCDKLNYFRQHSNKVTPKADSIGIKFTEGKYVFNDVMEKINLTPLQKKSAIGKFLKRILGFKKFKNKKVKKEVLADMKSFFHYSNIYIFISIYELDKLFDFSSLNLRKNKFL